MAKVKVFQVNTERDVNRVGFMDYAYVTKQKKFDESIYDLVFDGEVDTTEQDFAPFNDVPTPSSILEELFYRYNEGDKPSGYVGRSMSVSDVVKLDNDYYYVKSMGFRKIPFDETKTQMSKRFALC